MCNIISPVVHTLQMFDVLQHPVVLVAHLEVLTNQGEFAELRPSLLLLEHRHGHQAAQAQSAEHRTDRDKRASRAVVVVVVRHLLLRHNVGTGTELLHRAVHAGHRVVLHGVVHVHVAARVRRRLQEGRHARRGGKLVLHLTLLLVPLLVPLDGHRHREVLQLVARRELAVAQNADQGHDHLAGVLAELQRLGQQPEAQPAQHRLRVGKDLVGVDDTLGHLLAQILAGAPERGTRLLQLLLCCLQECLVAVAAHLAAVVLVLGVLLGDALLVREAPHLASLTVRGRLAAVVPLLLSPRNRAVHAVEVVRPAALAELLAAHLLRRLRQALDLAALLLLGHHRLLRVGRARLRARLLVAAERAHRGVPRAKRLGLVAVEPQGRVLVLLHAHLHLIREQRWHGLALHALVAGVVLSALVAARQSLACLLLAHQTLVVDAGAEVAGHLELRPSIGKRSVSLLASSGCANLLSLLRKLALLVLLALLVAHSVNARLLARNKHAALAVVALLVAHLRGVNARLLTGNKHTALVVITLLVAHLRSVNTRL
eukprot:Rhum_TRINITY_DN13543_c0_g5::Rhum_TRINITY_DN13543_c0_g5_i1::g.61295::m.61295